MPRCAGPSPRWIGRASARCCGSARSSGASCTATSATPRPISTRARRWASRATGPISSCGWRRNWNDCRSLREAVADGSVGWTKAQQVARVATPRSEAAWVAKAQGASREELAQGDQGAAAGAGAERTRPRRGAEVPVEPPPTVLAFRLSALDLARYEALVESIKKQGLVRPEATREEVLLAALANLAEGEAVRRRIDATPYQVVVYECETCKRGPRGHGQWRPPAHRARARRHRGERRRPRAGQARPARPSRPRCGGPCSPATSTVAARLAAAAASSSRSTT